MRKMAKQLSRRSNETLWAALFLLLPLCVYFTICILPSLEAFFYSFFDYDGFSKKAEFVGLKNYINLFTKERSFSIAFVNTILYTLVVTVLQNVISLLIALAIYRKSRVNNLFRLGFYLPVIFSAVAIGFTWSFIYDPNIGALNTLLDLLGLRSWQHVWLSEKYISILAIALVHVWWGTGSGMILYIAGLQNASQELLESSALDGCNKWQQFWKITFPMLSPVIGTVVVLTTIGSFRTFELVYVMTGGGADNSSSVLALLSYKQAFSYNNVGYASAIAIVLVVIIGVLSVIQQKAFNSKE